jgi:hypothetical protein
MSSFGQWYDDRRAEESGESSGSSWFPSGADQMLPLFDSESMQSLSWSNMKASMEAQMPKKVMGMGYQQRFQASRFIRPSLLSCICWAVGCISCFNRLQNLSIDESSGILRPSFPFCSFLRSRFLCRAAYDCSSSTEIRLVVYHGVFNIYDVFWHSERASRTPQEYVSVRPNLLYNNLLWFHVDDFVLHI